MKLRIAKPLTYFALLCYLFGASIASAHAFPSVQKSFDEVAITAMTEMGPMGSDCHKADNDNFMSMKLCKIFCASMSNLVITEVATVLEPNLAVTHTTFLLSSLTDAAPSLEPHPPK